MKRARHEVFSSRKIDTYSWMSKLVVSTIRRKKIDHGISVCFQGELSVIQLNSPFFLLVLLRSVLVAKKKRSLTFFFSFFSFFKFVGGYTSQCVF